MKSDIKTLIECLKFPSISTDKSKAKHLQSCATFLGDYLQKMGMKQSKVYQTKGHPLVFAQHCEQKYKPTVLIYGH